MKFSTSLLASILATHGIISYASQTPCDAHHQDALRCVYASGSMQQGHGKYIKVKEVHNPNDIKTITYCVGASSFPIFTIEKYMAGLSYKTGDKVNLQFSQCLDEDCTTSKPIMDDKFVVAKHGNDYISSPNKAVEITLDPAYGVDCSISDKLGASKNLMNNTLTGVRIADAINLLSSVTGSLYGTLNDLRAMQALAEQAVTGTHSVDEIKNLDIEYQLLKSEINKIQRVMTLNGPVQVSGGTLTISFGDFNFGSGGFADTLVIALPATDLASLYVDSTQLWDGNSGSVALTALNTLQTAIATVNTAIVSSVTARAK